MPGSARRGEVSRGSYRCFREPAEVIAEAPSSTAVLPLADFGTVNFAGATVNCQAIGTGQPIALTLVSSGDTAEATPSPLTGGNSFTVTWESSGSTTTAGTTSPGTGTPPPGTGTPGAGRHHHHHHHD